MLVGESPGSELSLKPTDGETPPGKTAGPPTESNSRRRRRRGRRGVSDEGGRKDVEWRNGRFNLSFDDDCGGYLALLFPSVVDTTPTTSTSAATDGAGSTTGDGDPSAVKKDSGRRASEPVDERSRLAANAAATYDGRTTHQPADVSRGGPAGTPEPTRDTRQLICDDDQVGGSGQESALRIVGEVLLPFLLAGLGSVLAGLVLHIVQVRIKCRWRR